MHTGSQSNKFTGLRVAGVLMATHTPFPTTASPHRRTDTCGSSTGITRTALSRLRFASFFRKGAREERRRLKPNPYRARAPEDAECRSNKRGIIFCQARRSSVFFLYVATNDIAWATSYLVAARSGAPGTGARYRVRFSVAEPGANGSSISMSLPESQM